MAVFFSGSGSTLQAVLDHVETLNIVCAFSSKKTALGRVRCRRQSILENSFKFPEDFKKTLELLKVKKIDTILCAGFMKILPLDFVNGFKGLGPRQSIVNIHPSLLPNYKGLKSAERAYADKNTLGVTIHDVVEEVDSGEFFKRLSVLNSNEISKVRLAEAILWLRSGEQQILRSWGSAVA